MNWLKHLLKSALVAAVIAPAAHAETTLDWIVAVVNKDIILNSDLIQQTNVARRRFKAEGRNLPADDVVAKQILESLVLRQLQLQESDKLGIKISDEELNNALSKAASGAGMSLDQWQKAIDRAGEDYQALREARREDLAIARVRRRALRDQVSVTKDEIDLYLANPKQKRDRNIDYRIGHILIALKEHPSADAVEKARKKAATIIEKAKAGTPFAELAQIYSDSPQALEGGDLGWRKANQLPTLFENAVSNMAVGDISSPMRNRSGLHVITLTDRREAKNNTVVESRVRHILVRPSEQTTDSEAQAKLSQVRDSIVAGAEFSEMAAANSEDPGSAARGGDLGYVTEDMLVPEFTDVMNAASIGDVSEPFRSPFGWHILVVEDRRTRDRTEQLRRQEAEQVIRRRKFEEAVDIWRQKLLDEAYVEVRL